MIDESFFKSVVSSLLKFPCAESSVTFTRGGLPTVAITADGPFANPAVAVRFPPHVTFTSNQLSATCALSGRLRPFK
jgi:hypothetical protein